MRAGLLTTSTSVEADYVPRFLFPNLPSLSILFDLYLYSEGTQASTLWRVSSWSPSRSCSFRCVSHHLRRLSPPLLASRAHSIGFRCVVCRLCSNLNLNLNRPPLLKVPFGGQITSVVHSQRVHGGE